MNKALNLFLNLLYPPKCVFCGAILSINTDKFICRKCERTREVLDEKVCCERCGKPLVSFGEEQLCYNCLMETHFYYKRIVSAFVYEKDVKSAILRYKKNPTPRYAKVFAGYLYKMYEARYKDKAIDYIVAVPGDNIRNLKRGNDQIDLLCTIFSELSGILYLNGCLKKIKKTPKQASLSYEERQDNLINSIRATMPDKIKGKTVLLIDDVCTTKATIKECSRELKFSGAKEVLVLTIATTVYKQKDEDSADEDRKI